MRRLASVLLGIVAATMVVTDADARPQRRRDHSYDLGLVTNDPAFRSAARAYARARPGLGALVPRGWHAARHDPDVPGSRFVSPMGDAWLHFYAVPANRDDIDQYWKGVSLLEGEDLRLLRRDRGRVEVSGFRGGRMYFRKAVLACREREWRLVEYEYAADAERASQTHVDRMSRAFDSAFTQFCDRWVSRISERTACGDHYRG
jgi:hypothetical protein